MPAPPFAPGHSAHRLEDHRFLTGRGRYVADVDYPRQLHLAVVRSPHAHGTIVSLNADAALGIDGVAGVHAWADLAADGLGPMPCVAELEGGQVIHKPPRTALANGVVRHVGDPVAFVLAESEASAREAAELVLLEIDALPAVSDPVAALEPGAPQLWPDVCTGNTAYDFHKGDEAATRAAIDSAPHKVHLSLRNNRVCAAPLETRAGIGMWHEQAGRYELFCNGQGLHAIRGQLATVFDEEGASFHLHAPDVGGGFGLKNFLYPEWVLLLWAARHTGRPVKWVEDRDEQFSAAAHGRGLWTEATLALDEDGRFLALAADAVADMGAYLSGSGPNVSTKALPTAMGGVYDIPRISWRVRGAFTNTAPLDAYRGAGKPEANYLIERLIDAAAARCGFDAVELRRRNVWRSFPHVTAWGLTIDCGTMAANIERALSAADASGFEERREQSEANGRLRGLGLTCFLETSRGPPQEGASVRFRADGTVEIAPGTESHGQGHETAFKQLVCDQLGLAQSEVVYRQADTDVVPVGFGHGGARSMHMGGAALSAAVQKVLSKGIQEAARLLQTDPARVRFAAGAFSAGTEGQSIELIELAGRLRDESLDPGGSSALDSFAMIEDAPFTFPNGAHAVEVEVDPESGHLALLSYVIADDYGTLINPALTEGQVHGGVSQGIGQALFEHAVYDPDSAQLLSGSFMDYCLPRASQLPAFEMRLAGEATSANPLGVKGCGQAGAIAAPQAVVSATLNALANLGVDHLDMPLTPEVLWRACAASQARPGKP